jgi:futalosine hydrolase
MKILLCAATEMEIAPTIHFLTTHQNYSIDILVTGIGLMSATYAITKAVTAHRPEFILQAGIAGSLDETLTLANVVAIKNETIGDLGVFETNNFHSLFDMNFLNRNAYPFTDAKLANNNALLKKIGLPIVNGVTVNEISTNKERINYYRNHFNAGIETMEGAAVHHIGLMERVPFLQIRSLSNFVGERDKTKWMMTTAIPNLNHELQRIISKFLMA